ncbi:MAG TPA: SMC family ATPase [Bacillota bacterium]|jgi:exonuclease SbcC|nr:SMC family ATPase [Fastidiosipila sp.]HQB81531.1 SMC family ATPase [Bacillota bacterium]
MKPVRMTLSAFGPYARETSISFEDVSQGIFLISGETGSGKTIIFDALMYALYDDTSGESRGNHSLRSDFAAPETETFVELVFSLHSQEYRIRRSPRYLRPKKSGRGETEQAPAVELSLPDGQVLTSKTQADQKIRELIGLDKDQFRQVVMIAQGAFFELIERSSNERAAIYRKLFDTLPYREMQEGLGSLYKEARDKSKLLTNRLFVDLARFDIPPGEEELKNRRDAIVAGEERWAVEKLMAGLDRLVSGLKERADQSEEELESGRSRLRKARESLAKLQSDNERIDQFEAALRTEKQLASEEKSYLEKVARLEQDRRASSMVLVPFGKREDAEARILSAGRQLSEAKINLDKAEAERSAAVLAIEAAKENSHRLESLPAEIGALEKEDKTLLKLQSLESTQKKIDEKIGRASSELDQLSGQHHDLLSAIRQDERELENLADVDRKLGQSEQQLDKISKAMARAMEIRAGLSQTLLDLEVLQGERQVLERLIPEWKADDARAREASAQLFLEQAGLLALELEEGKPCPVCGSTDHPQKAAVSLTAPSKEEVDRLAEKADKSRSLAEARSGDIRGLTERIDVALRLHKKEMESLLDRKIPSLPDPVKQAGLLEEELEHFYAKGRKELAVQEAGHRAEKARAERRDHLKAKGKTDHQLLADLEQQKKESEQNLAQIREEAARLRGEAASLREGLLGLDRAAVREKLKECRASYERLKKKSDQALQSDRETMSALTAAQTQVSSLQSQLLVLEEEKAVLEKNLIKALEKAAIPSEEAYKRMLLNDRDRRMLQEEVEAGKAARLANESDLERLRKETAGLSRRDEQQESDLLERLETEQKQRENDLSSAKTRFEIACTSLQAIKQSFSRTAQAAEEESLLKDLSDLASGQYREADQISFETYVQTWYFARVIRHANMRLSQMTGGRYILRRTEEAKDRRSRTGLDLSVEDLWNAKIRSTSSLSGGEKFQVVLSLALGLSDVVMAHAGGVEIDSLFIDEGFGSLDENSLQEAMGVLQGLAEDNRMIGLISHLSLLHQAVDRRLVAKKGENGSSIAWE